MNNLHRTNPGIRPDKYTFNTGETSQKNTYMAWNKHNESLQTILFHFTVIHAYAKAGGAASAKKAQELLDNMQKMHEQGNNTAKPDTITVSVEFVVRDQRN